MTIDDPMKRSFSESVDDQRTHAGSEQPKPCNCLDGETPTFDPPRPDRRRMLGKAVAAGAIAWAAPSIVGMGPAAAAGSLPSINATSGLWKWNQAPPTNNVVCSTGPEGNANRGSVQFIVDCTTNPNTIRVIITVVSGPALTGANQRLVTMLQSNAAGSCLSQTPIGTFNAPNSTAVTLGPINVVAGATHFSIVMEETGGGGTDKYSTTRVNLVC